jgi:predicted DNA-binding transcriptional regulator AlpA
MSKLKNNPAIGSAFDKAYAEDFGQDELDKINSQAILRGFLREIQSAIAESGLNKTKIIEIAEMPRATFYRMISEDKLPKVLRLMAKVAIAANERFVITREKVNPGEPNTGLVFRERDELLQIPR